MELVCTNFIIDPTLQVAPNLELSDLLYMYTKTLVEDPIPSMPQVIVDLPIDRVLNYVFFIMV